MRLLVCALILLIPAQAFSLSLLLNVRADDDGTTGTVELNVDRFEALSYIDARHGPTFTTNLTTIDRASISLGERFTGSLPLVPTQDPLDGRVSAVDFLRLNFVGLLLSPRDLENVPYFYSQLISIPLMPPDGDVTAEVLESIRVAMIGSRISLGLWWDVELPPGMMPIPLTVEAATLIPEPSTALLLGMGFTALAAHRSRALGR
jgi:hypothetical protein